MYKPGLETAVLIRTGFWWLWTRWLFTTNYK